MSTKQIVNLGIGILVAIIAIWAFSSYISYTNSDTRLRNKFAQKTTERTAFYDKMWKTFAQKAQIAVKNDSSFQRIVQIQMTGQADGQQVMMKWITQSNPTATFNQVSDMYKDLSRAIEAGRDEFFEQEKTLQDIKLQDDDLLLTFPGTVFLAGRKPLEYKPITSTRTDNVMQTGKDDDTKVF